jgi:hypothetical protein
MPSAFGRFLTHSAALLALSALGCAQERTPEARPDRSPRRLESVTWNSVKHELTWVISKGERDRQSGAYKPLSTQTYLINMDKATMTFNGETRGFSKQEAVNVLALLDIVAKYAIESTLWWDQGHGRRMDEKDKPAAGVTRVSLDGPSRQPADLGALLRRLELLERRLAEREGRGSGGAPGSPDGVIRPIALTQ